MKNVFLLRFEYLHFVRKGFFYSNQIKYYIRTFLCDNFIFFTFFIILKYFTFHAYHLRKNSHKNRN